MRKVRIRIAPPDLTTMPDVEHYATSYIISKSVDFDNKSNILIQNLKDRTNKLEYITDLDIGQGDTVYTRIMIHYRNKITKLEFDSSWSRTTPVSADQFGFKLSDIIIRTPKLTVEQDEHNTVILQAETMSLYSGGGSLDRTTWIVDNSDNYPIYKRTEDKTNLTTLKTQNIDIKDGRAYVFKNKFITKTSNESTFGKKLVIDYNRGLTLFDFTLLNRFVKGVRLYFRFDLYVPNFQSLDLEVRTLDGKVKINLDAYTQQSGHLLTDDLEADTVYDFYARLRFTDGQLSPWKKVYTGMCFPLNPDWLYGDGKTEYFDQGSSLGSDITFGDLVELDGPDGEKILKRQGTGVTSTYQMEDGGIIFTEFVNNALSIYRFDGINLFRFKRVVELPVDVDLAIDYVNVLPLPNYDIVINYCTVDNVTRFKHSIWKKFEYDLLRKTLTEVGSVTNQYERYSTSVSTSAVVDKEGNIWYVPANEVDEQGADIALSLYKLDTKTMGVSKVVAIPGNPKYNVTLIRDIDMNLYIFGGSTNRRIDNTTGEYTWRRNNNIVYKYDTKTDVMETLKTAYPEEWSIDVYCMQGYLKHDHQIVLFNSVHNGPKLGYQKVLIFDPKTATFSLKDLKLQMSIPFRNNIVLKDGSILRISSRELDPQKSYIYVAENNYVINNKPIKVDKLLNLVVPDGRLVEIEDPYAYESITIQGDGLLRWITGKDIKTFTSKDLIVTRDMTIEKEVFNAAKYDNVFILEGANLTVSGVPDPKQPVEKNLVVKKNENIKIVDPYYYDSIVVQDNGILRWVDEDTNTTTLYDSTWLIVTRDRTMLQAEFERGGWQHVLVLDGVNFKIQNEEAPEERYKTVKFFANGGTGDMPSIDVPFGRWTLPEPKFTAPAGKKFKCWAEDSTGATKPRNPGDTIEFGAKGIFNLYAIWTAIEKPPIPGTPNAPKVDGTITNPVKSGQTVEYRFVTDPNTKLNVTISSGEGTISVSNSNSLTYKAPTVQRPLEVTLEVVSYIEYEDDTGAIQTLYSDVYKMLFIVNP